MRAVSGGQTESILPATEILVASIQPLSLNIAQPLELHSVALETFFMQQRGQGFLVQFTLRLTCITTLAPLLPRCHPMPQRARPCTAAESNSQNLVETAGICIGWSFHFPGLFAGYTENLAKHLIHPSLRYSNSKS